MNTTLWIGNVQTHWTELDIQCLFAVVGKVLCHMYVI